MKIVIGKSTLLIDKKDWLPLSNINWYGGKYIYTKIGKRTVYLHRLILNAPKEFEVDHINGNSLDNRRSNLRLCTRSQNEANKHKPSHNTSGYKGVSLYKTTNKWSAYIEHQQKKIHIGYFLDNIDAAYVYDQFAMQLFGEYAKLNVVEAA